MIDFLAIAMVVGATLVGYLRGILRQALSVGAVVVAFAASSVLGWPISAFLMRSGEMSSGVAYAIGRLIAGVVIFASLSVAVRLADRRFGRTRHGILQPWNRNFGALAGVLFGGVLALALLCVADVFWKAMPESESAFVKMAGKSYFRTWVTANNPADQYLITDTLKFASIVKRNPDAMEKLKEQPEIQELLEHPVVQDVLNDEDLMAQVREASQSGEFKLLMAIARHDKVRKLLSDSALRKKIFSPQTSAALSAAVEEAEKAGESGQSP